MKRQLFAATATASILCLTGVAGATHHTYKRQDRPSPSSSSEPTPSSGPEPTPPVQPVTTPPSPVTPPAATPETSPAAQYLPTASDLQVSAAAGAWGK